MIKVLHIISDTGIGGAGILLLNLLRHRNQDFFSYSVAVPQNSMLIPRIEALDVRVIPLSHLRDRSADFSALPELLALLQEEKPDILHTHAGFTARLAGYALNIPVRICTKHCAHDIPQTPLFPLKRALQNRLSTHYIATAQAAGKALIREGTSPEKIHLILNGSDPLRRFSDMEKDAIKENLKIPKEAFVIGMAARMEKGKGQEILLDAAVRCLTKDKNLYFVFAGSGSMEQSLQKQAETIGISENIRFLGFCSDMEKVLNVFDLNVNCSYLSETSSLSLSEGMSLGIVPVVSDIGGNPYMVGYGENGAIFPSGDSEALSHILLSLYHSPKARKVLSDRAFQYFQTRFRASEMAMQTEALYTEALSAYDADSSKKTALPY